MNVNEPGIQYTAVLNKSVHFSFRSWKESLNCDGQPINETMSLTLEIQVLHDLGQAQKCSAGLNRLMGCKTSPLDHWFSYDNTYINKESKTYTDSGLETRVPRENHRPVVSHWQKYHIMLYRVHQIRFN
jgi:hypothetical protein